MPQVMYDKQIMFEGVIYSVDQSWREKEPEITIRPENARFKELLAKRLRETSQIDLIHKYDHWEIEPPLE